VVPTDKYIYKFSLYGIAYFTTV